VKGMLTRKASEQAGILISHHLGDALFVANQYNSNIISGSALNFFNQNIEYLKHEFREISVKV
jgi:hypothetical protein